MPICCTKYAYCLNQKQTMTSCNMSHADNLRDTIGQPHPLITPTAASTACLPYDTGNYSIIPHPHLLWSLCGITAQFKSIIQKPAALEVN